MDADYFSRNLPKTKVHKECCEQDFFQKHPHHLPVDSVTLYSLSLLRNEIEIGADFIQQWSPEFTAAEQRKDPELGEIIAQLEGAKPVSRHHLKRTTLFYEIKNKLLFRKFKCDNRVVTRLNVPRTMIMDVLKASHDLPSSAHFGVRKTLFRLQCFVCWKGMCTDVAGYVRSSSSCQFRKMPTGKPHGLQSCIPVASRAFEIMATDVLGPICLTESGHKYILNVTDQLTEWSISVCISDLTDDTTAKAIEENVFFKYGAPTILISDQGTNYMSSDFEEFLKSWNVKHHRSSPAHPQSNGMVEKFNGTLAMLLHSLANHNPENWDLYVPMAVYSYNVSWNAATKATPYYLVFGLDPDPVFTKKLGCSPADIHQDISLEQAREQARKHIQDSQQKNMSRVNIHRHECKIDVNHQVLVLSKPLKIQKGGKIANRWIGPFLVTQKLAENVYEISTKTRRKKIRVENSLSIKRFYPREEFELCFQRAERLKHSSPPNSSLLSNDESLGCEMLNINTSEHYSMLEEQEFVSLFEPNPPNRTKTRLCNKSDSNGHKFDSRHFNHSEDPENNVSLKDELLSCLSVADRQRLELVLRDSDETVASIGATAPNSLEL